MTKSILKLEAASEDGSTFRTTFKTKHGRMLYLSLVIQGTTCAIQDCFYLDRHRSSGMPDRQYRPQKLKTLVFPKDTLLSVIQSEMDKTFYGVEFVRNGFACLPLKEYLKHKADQDQKYRFLILVGEGEYFQGLPIRLRTRLKNQLHRAIYLIWLTTKTAKVWSSNAATTTASTSTGRFPSRRPRWSAASSPTLKRVF